MKSATQEVLFQIVCTVIFVLASILMITEFVSAQSIVKQYGKQMGIHNELQLQDGDSEDWDQWDGQQWVHTQIKVKSQDILNEILSCDQDIFIYVSGNEIPHDVIENAKWNTTAPHYSLIYKTVNMKKFMDIRKMGKYSVSIFSSAF